MDEALDKLKTTDPSLNAKEEAEKVLISELKATQDAIAKLDLRELVTAALRNAKKLNERNEHLPEAFKYKYGPSQNCFESRAC